MAYQVLAFVTLAIGALILLAAIRMLLSPRWLLGWLRGSGGLVLLACALAAGVVALEFSEFDVIRKQQPIASLSFREVSPQHYDVSVTPVKGDGRSYMIAGDMWQIDAKIYKWSRGLEKLGFMPGYQLGRLQGRYYAIEQERNARRTVYELHDDPVDGMSLWQLLQQHNALPWLKAVYGSATFLPMADGAIYTVRLSANGLVAEPNNEPARRSVSEWQ